MTTTHFHNGHTNCFKVPDFKCFYSIWNTTTKTGFTHGNFPTETKLCEISHGIPTNYTPNCSPNFGGKYVANFPQISHFLHTKLLTKFLCEIRGKFPTNLRPYSHYLCLLDVRGKFVAHFTHISHSQKYVANISTITHGFHTVFFYKVTIKLVRGKYVCTFLQITYQFNKSGNTCVNTHRFPTENIVFIFCVLTHSHIT